MSWDGIHEGDIISLIFAKVGENSWITSTHGRAILVVE
jgi:hypothetical protein